MQGYFRKPKIESYNFQWNKFIFSSDYMTNFVNTQPDSHWQTLSNLKFNFR